MPERDLLKRLETELATVSKNSRLFRAKQSGGVRSSKEFQRIYDLPRRTYTPEEELQIAEEMTEVLRTPTGTRVLRPKQAIALLEIAQYQRFAGRMRAGAGKTLVFFLAPYILGAKHPVYLLPAKLIDIKIRELAEEAKHWRVAYWINFLSYESLSRDSKKNYLFDVKCDCLMSDEAHKLKNPKAACTKRVREFKEIETLVPYLPGSGTFTKRSILDYAHQFDWALADMSPVPRDNATAEEWGSCIDEKPRSMFRTTPGALSRFANGSEDLDQVRIGFERRVNETPGVVATNDKLADCSLTINRVELQAPPVVVEAYQKLRDDWETPLGQKLIGGLDMTACAEQLNLGFFYKWKYPGPPDWLEARKAWAQFVRHVLTYNKSRIYSEFQVASACASGKLDREVYDAWRAIKKTFTPETVSVWISDHALKVCADWLKEGPGIIWTRHVDFAEVLSEVTGVPYCGQGGVDSRGKFIEDYRGESVIASVRSSYEGRNLQLWHRSLVTSVESQGALWEQLLARNHRDGQLEDEVIFDVFSGCYENERAFQQALSDAEMIALTEGQDQRLRYADLIWEPGPLTGPVWTKPVYG